MDSVRMVSIDSWSRSRATSVIRSFAFLSRTGHRPRKDVPTPEFECSREGPAAGSCPCSRGGLPDERSTWIAHVRPADVSILGPNGDWTEFDVAVPAGVP